MSADLRNAERDAWRDLCGRLVDAGAVTAEDLESPTFNMATPGQRLLVSLRAWGECRAAVLAARSPARVERWLSDVADAVGACR